ncbi:ubiquitin conjugating protein [Blastocystis sp. subtype 4]|uniref:ubiquitin conjugating protein n=1 Tax=Blastocystis sp. subtype 4 TaxID=944170 RepID=UPI000711BC11|nr:ubiquitin conjugating protein [Blastocystis sp. subtype 4]KNB46818.1 ubiquitin conjugating protein [Blastocystis sp. subtype 4]|eukprot:XP_014530261.1 ubiquitin conjugating protein [Blastocystis sp. subtype 4]
MEDKKATDPEVEKTDLSASGKVEEYSYRKREHSKPKSPKHGSKRQKQGSAVKRIQAELAEILLDPPCGIIAAPKDNNILTCRYEWEARLNGPEESPYAGDITFPQDYPFQPPKITFRTRIYHCNINSNGIICLDTIKNNWSAALTISKVLLTIMQLLSEPNPADPLVKPIAVEMVNSPETYFKTAQEWTKKYASPDLLKKAE